METETQRPLRRISFESRFASAETYSGATHWLGSVRDHCEKIEACCVCRVSAIQTLREHGQESWVLFVDHVKAYDTVHRDMLWKILTTLGVPVSLYEVLHTWMEIPVRLICSDW